MTKNPKKGEHFLKNPNFPSKIFKLVYLVQNLSDFLIFFLTVKFCLENSYDSLFVPLIRIMIRTGTDRLGPVQTDTGPTPTGSRY
jgi:hypothetical protein